MWVPLTRPFCPGHRRDGRRCGGDARHRMSPGGDRRDDPRGDRPDDRRGDRRSCRPRGSGARPRRAPARRSARGHRWPAPSRRRGRPSRSGLGAGTLDDAGHHLALVRQRDHDDRALLTGAGGATGAVEVVLVVGRRVDLHDHADVVDVDAAGGDVGRDEHVHRAVPEGAEHAVAHGLREPAVQRCGEHAAVAQLPGDPVGAELGAGEDDDASAAAGELGGEGLLVLRVDEEHVVAHRRDGGLGLVGRVGDRVDEVAVDEGVDALVERRREEQPLARPRGPRRGSR